MSGRQARPRRTGVRLVAVPFIAVSAAAATVLALSSPAMGSGGATSGADLQISGSISPSAPSAGVPFTETFKLKNAGPDTATSASFIETWETAAMDYDSTTVNGTAVSCAIAPEGSTGSSTATCALGDLASGAQDTLVVTLTAPAATRVADTRGSAVSQVSDPNTNNNDVIQTFQVGTGGGGTAPAPSPTPSPTPPPPTNGPTCASVQPSSASQTLEFTTNTMSTKITNCGDATLTDLVVMWNAGDTAPANAHVAFDCSAPNTAGGSFTLAAGASLTVNCKKNGFDAGPTPTESGTGTVSVYDECASPNSTLVAGGAHCTDEPQTLLAQADFSWSLAIPANPPARGGGRGGTG